MIPMMEDRLKIVMSALTEHFVKEFKIYKETIKYPLPMPYPHSTTGLPAQGSIGNYIGTGTGYMPLTTTAYIARSFMGFYYRFENDEIIPYEGSGDLNEKLIILEAADRAKKLMNF
jgi:hypothetical protein